MHTNHKKTHMEQEHASANNNNKQLSTQFWIFHLYLRRISNGHQQNGPNTLEPI